MSQIRALGIQPCPLSLVSHCFVVPKPPCNDSASVQPSQCHRLLRSGSVGIEYHSCLWSSENSKWSCDSPSKVEGPPFSFHPAKRGLPAIFNHSGRFWQKQFFSSDSTFVSCLGLHGALLSNRKWQALCPLVVTADSVSRQIRETESGFKPRHWLHVH